MAGRGERAGDPWRRALLALVAIAGPVAMFGLRPAAAQIVMPRPPSGPAPVTPAPPLPPAPSATTPAGATTLEGIEIALGGITYRVPRLAVNGSALSRDELLRLFDPKSPEPAAERVRRLRASEISAPEVTSTNVLPQGEQTVVYRDVMLRDVRDGRVASATASGGTLRSTADGKPSSGGFGAIALDDIDVGLALSLFTPPGAGIQVPGRVYGGVRVDGITMTDPDGTALRIGRVSGRDFLARPTSAGWLGTLEVLGQTGDLVSAPPAQRGPRLRAFAELLDAFTIGSLEMTGMSFGGPGQEGGRLDRVAFKGSSDKSDAELSLEGLEVGVPDGRVRFGVLRFGGVSLQPMLVGMREIATSTAPQLSPAEMRRLLPRIGVVRLDGLEADIPESQGPGGATRPAASHVALGRFELTAGTPIGGVPSDLKLALNDLSFTIPNNPSDDALRQLAQLGYDRVAGSFAAGLGWNEPGQELVLRQLSLDAAGMGSVELRGVFGHATRDLFDPDAAVASVAAAGLTGKSLELEVQNRGLFERIVDRQAQQRGRSPDDVRREYGMTAAMGIPALIGNSEGARALAQAVSRFIAKPGRLTITARARRPDGFGVADFMSGPNAPAVLNALDVTATAQ